MDKEDYFLQSDFIIAECYLRFSSQIFSLDDTSESIHLCNNVVQRKYLNGERDPALPLENMWDNAQFKSYLKEQGKYDKWDKVIYPGMKESIVASIMAAQESMIGRENSFELYGVDFMLTEDFSPWLIEINSAPAMGPTTSVTCRLCSQCLNDIIKVVIDRRNNSHADTGQFKLIYRQQSPTCTYALAADFQVVGKRMSLYGKKKRQRICKREPTVIEFSETKVGKKLTIKDTPSKNIVNTFPPPKSYTLDKDLLLEDIVINPTERKQNDEHIYSVMNNLVSQVPGKKPTLNTINKNVHGNYSLADVINKNNREKDSYRIKTNNTSDIEKLKVVMPEVISKLKGILPESPVQKSTTIEVAQKSTNDSKKEDSLNTPNTLVPRYTYLFNNQFCEEKVISDERTRCMLNNLISVVPNKEILNFRSLSNDATDLQQKPLVPEIMCYKQLKEPHNEIISVRNAKENGWVIIDKNDPSQIVTDITHKELVAKRLQNNYLNLLNGNSSTMKFNNDLYKTGDISFLGNMLHAFGNKMQNYNNAIDIDKQNVTTQPSSFSSTCKTKLDVIRKTIRENEDAKDKWLIKTNKAKADYLPTSLNSLDVDIPKEKIKATNNEIMSLVKPQALSKVNTNETKVNYAIPSKYSLVRRNLERRKARTNIALEMQKQSKEKSKETNGKNPKKHIYFSTANILSGISCLKRINPTKDLENTIEVKRKQSNTDVIGAHSASGTNINSVVPYKTSINASKTKEDKCPVDADNDGSDTTKSNLLENNSTQKNKIIAMDSVHAGQKVLVPVDVDHTNSKSDKASLKRNAKESISGDVSVDTKLKQENRIQRSNNSVSPRVLKETESANKSTVKGPVKNHTSKSDTYSVLTHLLSEVSDVLGSKANIAKDKDAAKTKRKPKCWNNTDMDSMVNDLFSGVQDVLMMESVSNEKIEKNQTGQIHEDVTGKAAQNTHNELPENSRTTLPNTQPQNNTKDINERTEESYINNESLLKYIGYKVVSGKQPVRYKILYNKDKSRYIVEVEKLKTTCSVKDTIQKV